MSQNQTVRVLASAAAARAMVAVAFALSLLAGCAVRLQSSNGTIGPYPENYEALVRDYVGKSWCILGKYELASVSPPVPGAVVVEAGGGVFIAPAAASIGWIVRTTGTGRLWPSGAIPSPTDNRTYFLLLRDGEVKTCVLNGYEAWSRGRRYVETLEEAEARGHIKRTP